MNIIYRAKFFITFFHIMFFFLILVLIDDGLDINYEAFFFASCVVMLMTVCLVYYFKITITDSTLKGYDFWGKYHLVEWNNILDVKLIRIGGLKYVRIYCKETKRPLWLPLFLKDIHGFSEAVIGLISEDNPLKVVLKNHINQSSKDT